MAKKQRFTISRQEAVAYIDEVVRNLDFSSLPQHLNDLFQEYQDNNLHSNQEEAQTFHTSEKTVQNDQKDAQEAGVYPETPQADYKEGQGV